jgi:hypothetical protein
MMDALIGTPERTFNPRTKALLIAIRQALIMVLGAIEDYLEMPRSIMPKHCK